MQVSDQILFEEALQLRVMDHDTYSSHDAIGKVTLMLSNYLDASSGDSIHQHYVKQWFPVYDTMHGLRGELQVELLIIPFGEPARPSVLLCSGETIFYPQFVDIVTFALIKRLNVI